VIGNAFKNWRHFRNRNHEAQITSSGLAKRYYVDALPINFNFETVDSVIVLKHLARDLTIAFAQGVHSALERLLSFTTKQQNPVAQ
jgi:hypothetical protein